MTTKAHRVFEFLLPKLSDEGVPAVDDGRRVVNLGILFADLLRNWFRAGVFAVLGLAIGLIYLAASTHKYAVSAQLIAIPPWLALQPQAPSNLSISSILQSSMTDLSDLFEASLENRQIYENLDQATQARQYYFSTMWDEASKQWHPPPGLRGLIKKATGGLRRSLGYPAWAGPTIDDLRDLLIDRMKITRTPDDRILIELKSADPDTDKRMLQFVIDESDRLVRAQMINYTQQTIANLRTQLGAYNDVSLQSAIATRLAGQMATKAMIEGNRIISLDFASVQVSDTAIYPSFKGTILAGVLIGLMLQFAMIVFMRATR